MSTKETKMAKQISIDKLPENRKAARELRAKLAALDTLGGDWTSLGPDLVHGAIVEVRKTVSFEGVAYHFVRDVRDEGKHTIAKGPHHADHAAYSLAGAVRTALVILGHPWDRAGREADLAAAREARS
jgi:hypothetical protein